MQKLLLVDDEIHILNAIRRTLNQALRGRGIGIEIFDKPIEALARASETPFDLVVSDFRMPVMDGVSFLKKFRELQPDTPRIILSAAADFDALVAAVNEAEIFRYLVKPWSEDDLVATVTEALELHARTVRDKALVDNARLEQGEISAEERERARLEALEPGITKVKWGKDGSVLLDDE
ncbi:MAG: response regulator [Betaproteobacteria bacterium]